MKRLHFKGSWFAGKRSKTNGWSIIILPQIMICVSKWEYTLIFAWLFWSCDIYYTRVVTSITQEKIINKEL